MFRAILVAATALFAATAAAADKTPFTVDDVYRVEQITQFQISPQGDEAVYVRSFYDVNSRGRRTAVWRIDGATGRRTPLEPGEPDGRLPVYSPDGRWLAFVSDRTSADFPDRDDVPPYSEPSGGVWYLNRISREVEGPDGGYVPTDPFFARLTFSRDSQKLLFVSGTDYRGSPVKKYPIEDDLGEGYEGYPRLHVQTSEFDGVDQYWVFHGSSRDEVPWGDPQWLPDGERFVFHANRTEDQESVRYSINKNYDLWMHGPTTARAEPRQLTENPGPDVSPRVSPDGKRVLYLSVPRRGPHMDVFNLCVLSLDGENPEPRVIVNAHDADRDADDTPPWQPTFPLRDDCWIDDAHVRVTGVRGTKTESRIFNVAGLDAPISTSAKPEPEPHSNPHLQRPEANPWLDERLHGPQELVRWKSFDGLEIEGVLTLPPPELAQFVKPYPVVVYPHGGPHSVSRPGFDLVVQAFASAGYAVFQPNYRGSYGYGRKFLDAARFDMGGSDMQDVLTGLDELIRRGIVDEKRQFVYGISYGGYTACRLVTLTDRFRAAVAQNAVTDLHAMWRLSDLQSWTEWEFGGKPWETIERDGKRIDVGAEMRERSPTTHAHRVKTPTLLLHADHDRRCPLPMGQMFHRLLQESGCETELVVYEDERHAIWQIEHQAHVLRRVLNWFALQGR